MRGTFRSELVTSVQGGTMHHVGIPAKWANKKQVTFEEFGRLVSVPQQGDRQWRRRSSLRRNEEVPENGHLDVSTKEGRRVPAHGRDILRPREM